MSLKRISVDLPRGAVAIPTSELGAIYPAANIIDAWSNTIKVVFTAPDGSEHMGIYSVLLHRILEWR